ncbi:hypothetical protein Tco_0405661, partial [Tanacetum coccineum]
FGINKWYQSFALRNFDLEDMELESMVLVNRTFVLEFCAKIRRIYLTGFLAQSIGSSNTHVLDSPCLLVLINGTSQSRQHGNGYPEKDEKQSQKRQN